MNFSQKIKWRLRKSVPVPAQYSLSISVFFALALISSWLNPKIGYQGVALIMLLVMSLLAMLFEFLPVLLAAVLSAMTWNYFFIPPMYEFNFTSPGDIILFLMYFMIAMVNAALSFSAKARHRKLREKEEKEKTISFYKTILNSLSHELRTPVATILGAVDAMNEPSGQLTPADKTALLDEVGKAALRLNQQIENLLGMSRLESGMVQLKLNWTDINELIHTILQKQGMPETGQSITFEPGENLPLFKLDALLIEQVLVNLLQNAYRYTPEKTLIKIITLYQNENCVITFTDNGPGFPEALIHFAFDKFNGMSQASAMGIGLGLSIVKGFVEAHNGIVSLTNNKDGGACFIIQIPAETAALQLA